MFLVESGLVYLGLQVSHFYILLADMSAPDSQIPYHPDR